MNSLEILRNLSSERILTGNEVFDAILEASIVSSSRRYENPCALEISIRLLDASEKGQIPYGCHDAIEHLAEECGLYPYVALENLNTLRSAAMEAFAVQLDNKIYLHAKQMEVLTHLEAGENIALSAPTSFGKSLVVDAFIATSRPICTVVIVPTIALIDETRRRLEKNFGDMYQIISKRSDIRKSDQAIFVLTQERFLNREDIDNIDFLFIDEFYKLDPRRDDHRHRALNVALYRALRISKQFFLAGPHIAHLNAGPVWKERILFMRSEYQTVTVNTIDRSNLDQRLPSFISDLRGVEGQQSLVYTRSPGSARKLVKELLVNEIHFDSPMGVEISNWLKENFHGEWFLADACKHGIGVHHGKIPRSVAQFFVQLFNDGELPVMICTSTLIEGVNTSAENVFIYDNEINLTPLDYFSFANIRGRVGRMMKHFVGKVYLYYTPPKHTDLGVDIPVLSAPDESDDYILINYDTEQLSDAGRTRQLSLPLKYDLSVDTLKMFGHFGADVLSDVKKEVRKILLDQPHRLEWSGYPDYNQRITVCELIRPLLNSKSDRTVRLSAKQTAWAWGKLLKLPNLGSFLLWFQTTFSSDEVQDGIERAFEFLGSCEFNQATSVAAVNALILEINPNFKAGYSFFALQLESWFRPPWMKELDEMGIPVPLSERLLRYLGRPDDYAAALSAIASLPIDEIKGLSSIDRLLIRRATTAQSRLA
ncbi:DEAD/DEAH box helicase [Gemmobacter fulvus]|uniref:DEAD/DEAH box helicase n=1 Tax=Gemmobacter fulvus TaxID=2840474 RepID=A0A975P4E8_9RHOB|nr:DEAD/DEAH box helicase [Gemmobacter fulvus]MBT9247858.1 DEAD/DEAH box helicase [Gemmobacter fulvus]QWK89634.1 DEAD/DEAH box helicase [Gemmobacter fulvus]